VLYVSHPASEGHETGAHPENPRRLLAIEAELADAGWLDLERGQAPAATRDQLERVHAARHVDAIEAICARGPAMIDADTLVSEGSFEAALRAAGGAAWAAERLLAGDAKAAFCALRPPGHHAESALATGFCLFNNVAVAAAHALAACGAERVLVLDWDVHHGNGTEEIFAASRDVLFASIHQWPLYPGTGPAGYIGEGVGEGYTLNLTVSPGAGGDDFLALVHHVVAPVARAYEPSLIAISAGYDAHRADPLASCRLGTEDFGELAAAVAELAAELGAPVLACLEGGYAPSALAASVRATIEGLAGARRAGEPARGPAEAHLERVRRHWDV